MVTGPDELLVSQVFPDSPASDIGLARGHQIVAINGRSVADLLQTGEIGTIFGPAEPGVTSTVRFREPGGSEREGQMIQAIMLLKQSIEWDRLARKGRTPGADPEALRQITETSVEFLRHMFPDLDVTFRESEEEVPG